MRLLRSNNNMMRRFMIVNAQITRLINPLLMWALVASGVSFAAVFLPKDSIVQRTAVSNVILVLSLIYWLILFISALVVNPHAGRSVSGVERVVTSGIYGLVRHPIYGADIVLAWGIFFYMATLRVLASVIWLTLILIIWMKLEDMGLRIKFKEQHEQYARSVPFMFPRLWDFWK